MFFAEEINEPLIDILRINKDADVINKYCSFIMEMWKCGSDEFRTYINEVVLNENGMMAVVPEL